MVKSLHMPRVYVDPAGIEFETLPGETVIEGANRAGYFWPEGCTRNGECTNCWMHVISGLGRVSAIGRYERANLIRQRGLRSVEDPRLRLACQVRIDGDVAVYKLGVQPY